MKKVIEFNTPDGVYQLDLEAVAKHRADYYVFKKQGLPRKGPRPMEYRKSILALANLLDNFKLKEEF